MPFLSFLVPFVIYLTTLCPTVYLGDSGELSAASFCLGIPHNPGYPLYCLIGKVFCLLPFGDVAFRTNLMSAFFGALTIHLVAGFILDRTSSRAAAFGASFFLAFVPGIWLQTVSAEVYTLHGFFVILLIRLLWWWDGERRFPLLMFFVFITGVSFGNHMQTVMLAPSVLFIVFSGDRKELLHPTRLCLISIVFCLALSIYAYLPIRTDAGAAIHFGDPNTFGNFLAHVSGSAHREGYVFTKGLGEYLLRAQETIGSVAGQYGVLLVFALWGWLRLHSRRWRVFFAGVVVCDLVYTVFLNIISIEITAFNLPTLIVLGILTGIGAHDVLLRVKVPGGAGPRIHRVAVAAAYCIPVFPLLGGLAPCDQSRNHTAYEHAVNIFRTVDPGGTLFVDGDNNIFPVTYVRVVEGMGERVTLYDRHNMFFRMPYIGAERESFRFQGTWEEVRAVLEREIISTRVDQGVFFAVFDPHAVHVPEGFAQVPFGILTRALRNPAALNSHEARKIWDHYSTVSFEDDFQRDYLNRQLCAHFYFRIGRHFFLEGMNEPGLRYLEKASRIGFNDEMIHSDIAVFLTDMGLFKEARKELELSLRYHEDLGGVHNNWGYYYHKLGDYDQAVKAFEIAVEISPQRVAYHNNLAFSLLEAGRIGEAASRLSRSLSIQPNQPKIRELLGNLADREE